MDYKDDIISSIAKKACTRISNKVKRGLQRMDDCLQSGDDSPLINIWDEICVQVQDEESFFGDSYLDTIRSFIQYEVERLGDETKQAIWLQTNEGIDWEAEHEEGDMLAYFEGDITEYILHDFVLELARNWTNKRIGKFLQREFD